MNTLQVSPALKQAWFAKPTRRFRKRSNVSDGCGSTGKAASLNKPSSSPKYMTWSIGCVLLSPLFLFKMPFRWSRRLVLEARRPSNGDTLGEFKCGFRQSRIFVCHEFCSEVPKYMNRVLFPSPSSLHVNALDYQRTMPFPHVSTKEPRGLFNNP